MHVTLSREERTYLYGQAGIALFVASDSLTRDAEVEPQVVAELRQGVLDAVAVLECVGWDPAAEEDEYELVMPRQQLQAMLDRYRADYRPDSLGYQTMIEDDVDDPEVRAEWRRDWHGTARALRDIAERVQSSDEP